MPTQIRPNRLVVNDRFPMLGFTIRTDGTPQRAEVTIATSPELFRESAQRTPSNFFSTSELGPLSISGGESVYVVPSEILARFIGGERLYFGLATAGAENGGDYEVMVTPSESSPYIAIGGLTGRSLRRIRMFPNRTARRRQPNGYTVNGVGKLSWAGDQPAPGMESVGDAAQNGAANGAAHNGNGAVRNGTKVNGNGYAPTAAAPNGQHELVSDESGNHVNGSNGVGTSAIDYDDGFGPLPPAAGNDNSVGDSPENGNGAAATPADGNGANVAPAPVAQALDEGSISIGALQDADAPEVQALGHVASTAIQVALAAHPVLTGPVLLARGIAEVGDVSVGIGPKVGAGLGLGGGLGYGLIFAEGNRLGIYGAAEVDIGAIAGASATLQLTILRGGIESFEGISSVASVSGGEGFVVGVTAVFDSNGEFLGVSIEGGVGVGSPFEIYTGVQRGIARQLGYAAAFGTRPVPAHAMIIDRDDVDQAQRYAPAWRDLFNWTVPGAVASEVRRRGMSVQRIQDAAGALNLDKYGVRCTRLPSGYTAESLLDHIRRNMNSFVDTDNTEFNPYSSADGTKWNSSSPTGAIFNLDIIGPDNAAVVGSMVEPRRFRFTTIETPDTGSHPVSGHREFGVRAEDNAEIFYTRGADRSSHGIGESLVFAGADHLWKSFQNRVVSFINSNGGSAAKIARFSERFHPEVVRILYGNASGQSLGADFDPLAIEVKYRSFIPSPIVEGPPLMSDYGGDGRGFSYDSGTSRGEITSTVHLTGGMGIDRVVLNNRLWGESTKYDTDDTVHVSGKPDWWMDKAAGAQPTDRATLSANDDNLRIYAGSSGQRGIRVMAENASAVTIHAAGPIPFGQVGPVNIAPDIDADVSVLFRNHNGLIQAKAVGRHDGFPAHELYVNGETLYRYDPVTAGNSPSSLVGFGDIDVDTDWVTVSRVYTVRTQGQTAGNEAVNLKVNDDFTVNWDEVELIAQPTDYSCWAASASMLIGWRDRISLTPESVANICGRSTVSSENFAPSDIDAFAAQLNLIAEPPQSYREDGFRTLLESKGPLWVVNGQPPTLHAVIVTGLYRDGGQLFVRVSDPWDRAVGTPGTPGAYADTHATGSRYIMKWQDFAAEYESAVSGDAANGGVNLQILHVGGTNGREPNRGVSTPAGYAQSALLEFNESFTINWDEVEQIAQPTDMSCWATAAAMVIGWRDRISLSPRSVAEIGGRSIHNGLDPAKVGDFAAEMGLVTESPQSYSQEGFRQLLEDNGPLWVGAAMPSLHVIVVTGIYNDGPQLYVRISDPWDRTVGTPGAPGPHVTTHVTGSRYIMTWEDFVAEYEAAAINHSAINLQILHSGGTDGRQPNRGRQTPPGYAQSAQADTTQPAPIAADTTQPSLPQLPSVAPPTNGISQQPDPGGEFPPLGATINRTGVETNGVTYDLAHLDGVVLPLMPAQVASDLIPGERVAVDDWPYIDGPSGRSKGGVAIDWSYAAGAVANIRVHPSGGQALDGWNILVTGNILQGPSTPTESKVKVLIRTTFSRNGEAEQSGVSEVTLCGSGQVEKQHRQEADQSRTAPAAPQPAVSTPQLATPSQQAFY